MADKKLYLIDMDGVLADTLLGFNTELKKKFPSCPPLSNEKITSFYIESCYPEEIREEMSKIWSREGLYYDLAPIAGGFEALNNLLKTGNEYRICTVPNLDSKTCEGEKKDWIRNYLGKEGVKRLVITQDKTIMRGNYLIDDKPEVKGIMLPHWEHILYSQPWNASITNKKRLTWGNYKEVLKL